MKLFVVTMKDGLTISIPTEENNITILASIFDTSDIVKDFRVSSELFLCYDPAEFGLENCCKYTKLEQFKPFIRNRGYWNGVHKDAAKLDCD